MIKGDQVRLIDFDDPDANDWLAVNQFTVIENKTNRRPDVVLFVNGLPLGVIELKNAGDENATSTGHSTSFRRTRRRTHPCSAPMRRWSFRTASRPGSAR